MTAQNVVAMPSVLEGHARRLKKLMEEWSKNTISIGLELLAAQESFPLVKIPGRQGLSRPNWENWVKQNTGISIKHAYNLMRVAKRFDVNSVSLKTSQAVMLLLASDATPGAAKQEIRSHLEKGEHVDRDQAKRIVQEHKFPKPSEANKQARETGMAVQASDGNIYFGASKEEAELAENRRTIVYGVRRAIETLSEVSDMTPLNFLKFMLPHQRWTSEEEGQIEKAKDWLVQLAKEWNKWEDK